VLSKILFPREAGAGTALAVVEGTEEGFLGAAVHLVDFALVSQQSATVGEALELLAAFDVALVGTVMLVHVFAVDVISIVILEGECKEDSPPLALAIEEQPRAFVVPASHLPFLVPRRFFGPFVTEVLPQRSVIVAIL
jgi:hypothetical protein